MAINRIWQTGCEFRDMMEFDAYVGTNPAMSNTVAKTGSWSFFTNGAAANQFGQVFPPASRQFRTGFWYYPPSSANVNEGDIVFFRDISLNVLVSVRRVPNSSNAILKIAGVTQDTEVGALPASTWWHIGVDLKIDAINGWVKVYKDGVEILSFTGNTGNADIVEVGYGYNVSYSGNHFTYYDDLFLDDSTGEGAAAAVEQKRFQFCTPDGNGNYNGNWAGSDGDSVNNYLLVDEYPPNTTDYIQISVTATKESFTMTTYTLAVSEACIAVIPTAVCQRTGVTELIKVGTRYSATDLMSANLTPEAAYRPKWVRQTTKPGGGAWTQAAIDGFELVVESAGTF